jgi:hypothetical protein
VKNSGVSDAPAAAAGGAEASEGWATAIILASVSGIGGAGQAGSRNPIQARSMLA